MLRRVVGVGGAGARDPSARARLEAALPDGAWWEAEGLLLRHTGPAPARVGEVTVLLDGSVYAGPASEAEIARAWSPSLPASLRGDFVLLAWDHGAGSGVFVTDHLGGRSLCWCGSVLGSEVRDVLAALPRRPGPDDVSVARWLGGGGPPAGRTLYAGVRRLAGGRSLAVPAMQESAWWQPRFGGVRAVAAAEVRTVLGQAVERRLGERAGVLLSGGLDSGSVAAVAATGRDGLPAYSAVFPDAPSVDESELIAAVGSRLGLRSSTFEGRPGAVLQGTAPYLRAWELPPSSPNLFFWLPMLEGAAADGVRTLLDGEGGDEVFGAARWLIADELRRGRPDRAVRLARRFPGAGDRPPWRPVARVLLDYGVRGALPAGLHTRARRARGGRHRVPGWLTERAAAAYVAGDAELEWKRGDGPRWWQGLLNAVRSPDGPVLARDHIRRRSELAGVEPRHPLHDVDVVELMLGSDPAAGFDPHLTRPLLREAMRGLLPDEVRLRPGKSTFDAVFQRSLHGPERPALDRLLRHPAAEIRAYADLEAVDRELLAPGWSAPGRGTRTLMLWRLATIELWLRHQHDREPPPGPRTGS